MPPALLLALGVPSLLTGIRYSRAAAFEHHAASQSSEDVYYLPADEHILRGLTLGYYEVAADLLWMRALLYYAENLSERGTATCAVDYAEALASLDPGFAQIYHWAGMVPFYISSVSEQEARVRCVEFMVRGTEQLPNDGQLAWDTASTILYELLPPFEGTEAERERWRARAGELTTRAVRLGAGPPWLAVENAALLTELGETDRAARVLEQRMALTHDMEVRADLLLRLQRLRAGADAALFEAELRRFEEARLGQFPYLTLDEYVLVGSRRFP